MIIRLAIVDDIEAILQLQEKYHVSNLTEAEKQQKGFVTMRITPEQLTQLIDDERVFIATSDDDLAAYTLTGTWDFDRQWDVARTSPNGAWLRLCFPSPGTLPLADC